MDLFIGSRNKIKRINPKKTSYFYRVKQKLIKYGSIFWFILPAAFLALLFGYIPLIFILAAFKEDFILSINSPLQELFRNNWSFIQFGLI